MVLGRGSRRSEASFEMSYSLRLRRRAIRLYVDGMSYDRVGRLLAVCHSSVANWCRAANCGRTPSEATKNNPRRPRPLVNGHERPSKSLAYIVGVLMGDGWIRKDGFALTTVDPEFVRAFSAAIRIHFRLDVSEHRRKPSWMVSPNNGRRYRRRAQVGAFCGSRLASAFLESVRNEAWVSRLSRTHKLAWIRGVWDSDGSITKQLTGQSWSVRFHNRDPQLAALYRKVLDDATGIIATVYRERDGMWIARFGKIEEVARFFDLVAPTIARKCERFERAKTAFDSRRLLLSKGNLPHTHRNSSGDKLDGIQRSIIKI